MGFVLLVCARLSERKISNYGWDSGARQEMCKVIFVLNSATGVCCIISLILDLVRLWGSVCILGSLKEKYRILQTHSST